MEIFTTSAQSNLCTTLGLGKAMANLTMGLLTTVVKPHAVLGPLSNQVKVINSKHCGLPRELHATTYHLLSIEKGGTRFPFSAPPRIPKTLEELCN